MDLPRLKIGNKRGSFLPVYIEDRYTGIFCPGKSGSGKSVLILLCWEQDHRWKVAKVLVDPSGFLARDAYSISGGIYCSLENPVSFNPMRMPYSQSQISDVISEAINQVISLTTPNQHLTTKMRVLLDEAVKWCLERNRKSLLHVRDYIAAMKGNTETRDGILARLNFILNDPQIEKMLCQNDTLLWSDIIKNKKTVILDCFSMSRDKMIFVGNILTQGIKNYFRYEKQKEYQPLAVYVDEFHNFVSPNIIDIINEGRKYKLAFFLASQGFAAIDELMKRAVLNVGNIAAFKLGYREASYVAKELDFTPQELQFIEKYHVAYMTKKERGIAKVPRPPFVKTLEPPKRVEPPRKPMKPSWFTLDMPGSYQAA